MIKLKRIYDDYELSDGFRILVDRLWPRGISKDKAHLDLWLKEIAPSDALRKWFHHDTSKWYDFEKKYKEELQDKSGLFEQLHNLEVKHKTVTLLYGAKDREHNQAVVIADLLK
jgi:uncharacterized protein YeaO (DUF488 family)